MDAVSTPYSTHWKLEKKYKNETQSCKVGYHTGVIEVESKHWAIAIGLSVLNYRLSDVLIQVF